MPLVDYVASKGVTIKEAPGKRKEPLWKGPQVDGITFSMLSRFLVCPERFRLHVIEGLQPIPDFNHFIEYGNMWHVCEEALAKKVPWLGPLNDYVSKISKKYPFRLDQVDLWYNVCKTQFPLYVRHWRDHPDVQGRRPIYAEKVFRLGYIISPSKRMVILRGKWDSVDFVKSNMGDGVYIQENKSKGEIRDLQILRQLSFDLQTMIYLVALMWDRSRDGTPSEGPIKGVRYNVVKRPIGSGKGNIKQRKPSKKNPNGESKEAYFARMGDIISKSPGDFFKRWIVNVYQDDIKRFCCETLDPILENLCNWYDFVTGGDPWRLPPKGLEGIHWRRPFGVYNVLDEGGCTDVDEYLATGSEKGLTREGVLFPELQE